MTRSPLADEQLAALAAYLTGRRGAILQTWCQAVATDPHLPSASALSPSRLHDHIPDILDEFEARLRAKPGENRAATEEEIKAGAAKHGRHRWQQGYQLREVTREWGHLHLLLVDELAAFAAGQANLDPAVLPVAHRALARLFADGISESTSQYFQLRQAEATGNVRALEQALDQWKELERQRGEAWREAAHDLRGNLGVVRNATALLGMENVPEKGRASAVALLQRGVASLQALLEDVLSLARLQAGHEQRVAEPFDAAEMLTGLVADFEGVARQRGLCLTTEGSSLAVEGDAVKLRRVIQNLLVNALKYTTRGGVTIGWGDSRPDDPERWVVWIRDTGPGMPTGSAAPLTRELKQATREAREADGEHPPPAAPVVPLPPSQEKGEGVGLAIVKRMCDLLDATVELESQPGVGTTFRVTLPRRYPECPTPALSD